MASSALPRPHPGASRLRARSPEPRAGHRPGVAVWATMTVAALAPLVVAVAWIPVRTRLPNTDLALVLVAVVAAIGLFGRRSANAVAALSAGVWFEFFDTVPYERLAIARQPDIETTLFLVVVAGSAAELALRVVRSRSVRRSESATAAAIRQASARTATGEELVRVVDHAATDLREMLGLRACWFVAGAGDPAKPRLERDGRIVVPPTRPVPPSWPVSLCLPVLGYGEEIGHFVLQLGDDLPGRDRLLAAVTVADQVGAAVMVQAPPAPA